eukprot:EG_transcript_26546
MQICPPTGSPLSLPSVVGLVQAAGGGIHPPFPIGVDLLPPNLACLPPPGRLLEPIAPPHQPPSQLGPTWPRRYEAYMVSIALTAEPGNAISVVVSGLPNTVGTSFYDAVRLTRGIIETRSMCVACVCGKNQQSWNTGGVFFLPPSTV